MRWAQQKGTLRIKSGAKTNFISESKGHLKNYMWKSERLQEQSRPAQGTGSIYPLKGDLFFIL